MRLGITGSRHGASITQYKALLDFIKNNEIMEFHHGDCLGVDMQAHYTIRFLQPDCKIIIHPPIKNDWRAWCKGAIIKEPLNYTVRDRIIVDSVDLLIGCPKTKKRYSGSGSWYTIDYAKKIKKKHIIFQPC